MFFFYLKDTIRYKLLIFDNFNCSALSGVKWPKNTIRQNFPYELLLFCSPISKYSVEQHNYLITDWQFWWMVRCVRWKLLLWLSAILELRSLIILIQGCSHKFGFWEYKMVLVSMGDYRKLTCSALFRSQCRDQCCIVISYKSH